MIRFFNMFSDGSGVQAGLERAGNSLDLRLKAPSRGGCGGDRGKNGGGSMILKPEKDAILMMRRQGCSYKEIAEHLMLSSNTVKSICRRSDVKTSQSAMPALDTCKNCGASLLQNTNGRRRTFCSTKCRYVWWNHARSKQPFRLTCYHCGRQFISYGNRKRKFCGRECYILSRYGEGLP